MTESLKEGRYRLLGTLGEGAQGQTFDAVDLREGRPVAVKRFDIRTAKTWKEAELAEREARVLQGLSHPKLPRYVDHFEEGGALYLVMDKIDGESLASLRKRGVVFSRSDVARLLHDASEVLDYLHGRSPPVIHRDLKPSNVIRRPDGSFAFVDFGAVRDRLRQDGGSTVVGTFGYMAPEQFQGRALPASDVYAVGATALSMMTGEEPENLPHRGLAVDVRAALGRTADDRVVGVLSKMLDPDPDVRASRLAPLLPRLEGGAGRGEAASAGWKSPRDGAGYDAEPWRDLVEEVSRRHERQARRQARKAARHAERVARHLARRSGHTPPWPPVFASLLIAVGALVVTVVTQLVVPLLLTILSAFFARNALRAAAAAVREGGRRAVDEMHRHRRWAEGDQAAGAGSGAGPSPSEVRWPEPDQGIRVSPDTTTPKTRVATPGDHDVEDDPSLDAAHKTDRHR